ncbi:hypothetical protein [Winogradskyella wandonensis]|uniref:hypothetical protein n=1 Tax=Winogradskyella wandonensis TaxID=1442586 RepID=UPI00104745FB|nr:hypothetical protein [Winogradskyella wandonensis]
MRHIITLVLLACLLMSCGSSKPIILSTSTSQSKKASNYTPFFDVTEYAEDESYGLKGDNPVRVGEKSVENQIRYISSLAGPNGEELKFIRTGSCCAYDSETVLWAKH